MKLPIDEFLCNFDQRGIYSCLLKEQLTESFVSCGVVDARGLVENCHYPWAINFQLSSTPFMFSYSSKVVKSYIGDIKVSSLSDTNQKIFCLSCMLDLKPFFSLFLIASIKSHFQNKMNILLADFGLEPRSLWRESPYCVEFIIIRGY